MDTAEEQWLTGFWEGDGHVGVHHNLVVRFGQKERDVLDYICDLINAGYVYQRRNGQYELDVSGKYCVYPLTTFSKHVVSVHSTKRLNAALQTIGLPTGIAEHLPSIDWLTGFWDAEGSSSNVPGLYIGQKEREVLDAIRSVFGGSTHHSGRYYQWSLVGDSARRLAAVLTERSRCRSKAERLRDNLNGPTYYELHRSERRSCALKYHHEHKEERNAASTAYHREHKEAGDNRSREHYRKSKLVADYIREHPKIVEKLKCEST